MFISSIGNDFTNTVNSEKRIGNKLALERLSRDLLSAYEYVASEKQEVKKCVSLNKSCLFY